jgi:hypothetical protein
MTDSYGQEKNISKKTVLMHRVSLDHEKLYLRLTKDRYRHSPDGREMGPHDDALEIRSVS